MRADRKIYKIFNVSRNSMENGMSLIEMLVVISIISIMTAVGLLYINSSKFVLNSEARNLRSFLMHSKSEAIKRNTRAIATIYEDNYGSSLGSGLRDLDSRISILSENFTKFSSNTKLIVRFDAFGRAEFEDNYSASDIGCFHAVLGTDGGHYLSVLVNYAGKISIIPNDPANKNTCSDS